MTTNESGTASPAAELADAAAALMQQLTAERLGCKTALAAFADSSTIARYERLLEELQAVHTNEDATPLLYTTKLLQLYNELARRNRELDAVTHITRQSTAFGYISYLADGATHPIEEIPWDVLQLGLLQICKVLQRRAVQALNQEILKELQAKLPAPQSGATRSEE